MLEHVAHRRDTAKGTTAMHAAVIHEFGQPPHYEDFPEPRAGDGQVLVHMKAAGLHQIVRSLASGEHYGSTGMLPLIPGLDGVGVMEDGSRVYVGMPSPPYGTMAEVAAVDPMFCIPLPDSLDDYTAAAIFNPGMSSWLALRFRAGFQPGQHVLVNGATGTAGKLAVQIARQIGAERIIASGRNDRALSELLDLGADATIDLKLTDAEIVAAIASEVDSGGIDIVLDYLWGHPAETIIQGLMRHSLVRDAAHTRYVEIGQIAGPTVNLSAEALRGSALEILGSGGGSVPVEKVAEQFPEFLGLVASGDLKIDIDLEPLSTIEAAWQQPTSGRRLVFTI